MNANNVEYPPVYASIDTIAHHLDCSARTVREYVDRGLLPQPIRLGSLVRWRWEDVDAAVQRTKTGAVEVADPILRSINGG